MLRDAAGYSCEVKTAQETGESGGISRNHWEIRVKFGKSGKISEFRGNSGEIRGILVNFGGKLGGNSGKIGGNRAKIGELCFPNGETEFTDCEINFSHIREKGGK